MGRKVGKSEEPGFEESLELLEELVAKMEEGSMSLDESLKAFEDGMALYRRCASALENARQRVEKLIKEGEKLAAVPLEVGRESGEE